MPGWARRHRGERRGTATARRLVGQLRACEAAALAFCRLLERWGRGDAVPATPGARQAAFRHAADRVETALAGLERPLSEYLARARAGPRRGTLVVRRPRRRGARRVAAGARACRCLARARTASPPSISSSRCWSVRSRGSRTPRGWTSRPTARPLGGPLRPPRHAARHDGRRPSRARRVSAARALGAGVRWEGCTRRRPFTPKGARGCLELDEHGPADGGAEGVPGEHDGGADGGAGQRRRRRDARPGRRRRRRRPG